MTGQLEWRDPVTIRFTPGAVLPANTRYTVTVANTFSAMDESRLEAPFHFTFRVRGPRLLTGSPVSATRRAKFVTPTTRFELVYSAPADLERLATTTHLEFDESCTGPRLIRLKPVGQRPITATDSWEYKAAGGYRHDGSAPRGGLEARAVVFPEFATPAGVANVRRRDRCPRGHAHR